MANNKKDIQTFDLLRSDRELPFSYGQLADAPASAFSNVPRRHTFYLLLWITKGTGANVIDFEQYPVESNQLHLVKPGQVQYWVSADKIEGKYVAFKEELFILAGSATLLEKLSLFDAIDGKPVFTFSEQEAKMMGGHLDALFEEHDQAQNGWVEAIVSWLQLILIAAQRRQQQLFARPVLTAGQTLTRSFQQMVKTDAIEHHGLGHYADGLGVTVSHLSETTKEIIGVSAGKLIRQQRVLEAKRLLAHSSLTVAQIGDQLNFEDASYFGRFFKRETSQTPRQFRTSFLTN